MDQHRFDDLKQHAGHAVHFVTQHSQAGETLTLQCATCGETLAVFEVDADPAGLVCPECGGTSITIVEGHASCNGANCSYHGDPTLFEPAEASEGELELEAQ
jgi:NAD-dependent SIR2 family protein deacetylase